MLSMFSVRYGNNPVCFILCQTWSKKKPSTVGDLQINTILTITCRLKNIKITYVMKLRAMTDLDWILFGQTGYTLYTLDDQ